MSATAKTLGSLGLALVGLLAYLSINFSLWILKIPAFGAVIYLGVGLSALLFLVIVTFSVAPSED